MIWIAIESVKAIRNLASSCMQEVGDKNLGELADFFPKLNCDLGVTW